MELFKLRQAAIKLATRRAFVLEAQRRAGKDPDDSFHGSFSGKSPTSSEAGNEHVARYRNDPMKMPLFLAELPGNSAIRPDLQQAPTATPTPTEEHSMHNPFSIFAPSKPSSTVDVLPVSSAPPTVSNASVDADALLPMLRSIITNQKKLEKQLADQLLGQREIKNRLNQQGADLVSMGHNMKRLSVQRLEDVFAKLHA